MMSNVKLSRLHWRTQRTLRHGNACCAVSPPNTLRPSVARITRHDTTSTPLSGSVPGVQQVLSKLVPGLRPASLSSLLQDVCSMHHASSAAVHATRAVAQPALANATVSTSCTCDGQTHVTDVQQKPMFVAGKARQHKGQASTNKPHATDTRRGLRAKPTPATLSAALQRAYTYPYTRAPSSFLFINGDVYLFDTATWQGLHAVQDLNVCKSNGAAIMRATDVAACHGFNLHSLSDPTLWMPVLAVGSNASPQQLAHKFLGTDVFIPVVECVLEDFDVVYAPFIAHYGSCTATLQYSPGTCVAVHVLYLTEDQLFQLNASEGRYDLCQLTGVQLHVARTLDKPVQVFKRHATGVMLDSVAAYCFSAGVLSVAGPPAYGPIALLEVPAYGRQFTSLDQRAMLQLLNSILRSTPSAPELVPSPAGSGLLDNTTWDAQSKGVDGHVLRTLTLHGCGPKHRTHAYRQESRAERNRSLRSESDTTAVCSGHHNTSLISHRPGQRLHENHQQHVDVDKTHDALDEWVIQSVWDSEKRVASNHGLRRFAAPLQYMHVELLQHCAPAQERASETAVGYAVGSARFVCGPPKVMQRPCVGRVC